MDLGRRLQADRQPGWRRTPRDRPVHLPLPSETALHARPDRFALVRAVEARALNPEPTHAAPFRLQPDVSPIRRRASSPAGQVAVPLGPRGVSSSVVLSASKTGETRSRYDVEELDIGRVLEGSAAIVRSRYNLDPGSIRIAENEDGIRVLGDADELQTAFVNLLDNAVKYSPGGAKVSVRVKASPIRNRIDIFVKDNGVGMEGAELKRVFKRFYRVPQADGKKVKGTGLGLFIVNSIIKKHGGSIRADSKGKGRGSTFIVQLPKL